MKKLILYFMLLLTFPISMLAQYTGGNGRGDVTGSQSSANLPISLLLFTPFCNGNNIVLNWSTASETNNDYFTVERSLDAISWQVVTTVNGAGNSNIILNYKTTDTNPLEGISYYRLKQTDYDGKSETFSAVAVSCVSNTEQPSVLYFPNPFTSEITVENKNVTSENASITVYDIFGSKVFTKTIDRDELGKTFTLNLSDLAKGIYTIEFRSNSYSNTGKIVGN